MIQRWGQREILTGLLSRHPVVAILGMRQVGKTTLAREVARRCKGKVTVFDLEDPADVERLAEPMFTLRRLRGTIILDEIQRRPELFPVLRVLADRPRAGARFLVLGSASPQLLRQSSESLAGRIAYHELGGFTLAETGMSKLSQLWFRGGLPRSFLARTITASGEWRREFIRTFLERDIPQLGFSIPAPTLRRFWSMLSRYHGQIWNASQIGSSLGVADTTVRKYLDLLSSTFVIRILKPWHENLSKRQVKAPKIYFTDSGLLHSMLDIHSPEELDLHPMLGASWEGFLLGNVIDRLKARPEECYFWSTHSGAELDLLIVRGRRRYGFEFKRSDAPSITKSMRVALDDLKLTSLTVIHAGDESYPLAPRVEAVAARRMLRDLKAL